jgi:1-acyl-sn-glycerol-3-phosphate acyltransferase
MKSRKFHYYTPIVLQKVGWLLFGTIYKIFFRIEVKGKENLVGLESPIILASNHTSELDVTSVELIFPFFSKFYPIYFVSDPKERFKSFGWRNYIYGGVFFNWLGGYSIHKGFKNYAFSLENHMQLLFKGKTVFIFPEGKRTSDGNLGKAHGGLGYMTYVSDATVVPIAIDTFFNVSWKDFLLMKRRVTLHVLKPFTKAELFNTDMPVVEDFQRASKMVLDRIGENL